MATTLACGPVLSCSSRGLATAHRSRIPITISHLGSSSHRPLLPAISCKSRRKGGGSPRRKRRSKKLSEQPPLNLSIRTNIDGMDEVQEVAADFTSNSHLEAKTSASVNAMSACTTDATTSKMLPIGGKSVALVRNADIIDSVPSHLEDLMNMIKAAETNVFLLNESRVRALKDIDKLSMEKDLLQEQIRFLKMKLPDADECNGYAVHRNKDYTLTEPTKNAEYEPIICVNVNKPQTLEVPVHANSFFSLSEDLSALKEENMSLKFTIQNLNAELCDMKEMAEAAVSLKKERSLLEESRRDLEHRLAVALKDVSELPTLRKECDNLFRKVESLEGLVATTTEQADQAVKLMQQNDILQREIKRLEVSLEEAKADKSISEKAQRNREVLQQKVEILEHHLEKSEGEIKSHIQLYEAAVREFQDTLDHLKEESKRRAFKAAAKDTSNGFWSSLLIMVDGWLLEKKICADDAKLLRKMVWKRDIRARDAYLAFKDQGYDDDGELILTFVKLASSPSSGLNIVHVASELTPIAKVTGLGDAIRGLSKALQSKGHIVEIVLPKYDCMRYEFVNDLKMLDVEIRVHFDGTSFQNKVWVGTVEGLPVYFMEPQHPSELFGRRKIYGEIDDFKRFSYFSCAALELLYQAGKKPDIIHCHNWHTAFVAPLYWETYVAKGLDSARICFTCHNFEHQGAAPASELAVCGLDVKNLNRQDRMQDHSCSGNINPVKGAVVYSNIVTTISPAYANEMKTAERGRGLHETLQFYSGKFVGILNGLDSDSWNPSTDKYIKFRYADNVLQGKTVNKEHLRKLLNLSSDLSSKPLVGCTNGLLLQDDVHLVRHAIHQTMELGGQFVLLGSSLVSCIQMELEDLADQFQSHPNIRLIFEGDDFLLHLIYAASDLCLIPSIIEPHGLPQIIAMRYGSVPLTRKMDGLKSSVFDMEDDAVPIHLRNGFTFSTPEEKELGNAMTRAFKHYESPESWQELIQKNMRTDFSWDSCSLQYEDLYQKVISIAG